MTVAPSELAVNGGPKLRTRAFPPRRLFGEDEKAAAMSLFDDAIRTGGVFGYGGPDEEAYCREFAAALGEGYADLVNSGSSAVYVALRALDLEPFGEVICPALTDPGGIMPIPLLNCIPIPADTRPGSYNVGPDEIEACLSPRTVAILVAHIAGEPADMDPILAVARARNIPVVEDCAQAHGARYKGRPVGTMGDIAAFSTMSGKHHATAGQGGVVFTRREELYWAARRASDRGKPFGLSGTAPKASSLASAAANVIAAHNLNGNDLAGAVGRVQLRKLDAIVRRRREVARRIGDGLRARSQTVSVGWTPDGTEATYWFLRLHVDATLLTVDATSFARSVAAEGIPLNPAYGAALQSHAPWFLEKRVFGASQLPWSATEYCNAGGDPDRRFPCPNAVAVIESDFNLSIHEGWGDDEIQDTLAAIEKVEAVLRSNE